VMASFFAGVERFGCESEEPRYKSYKRDEGVLLALREGRAYDAKLCLG